MTWLSLAGTAGAVDYGISDSPSSCASWGANSCNQWSYGLASYLPTASVAGSALQQLRNNLPLHYARVLVPYDAAYDARPTDGVCRYSYNYTRHTSHQYPSGGGPGSAWFVFVQELKDARAAGLQTLVAITQATGDDQQHDGDPATPDVSAADATGPAGLTTVAGEDYSCGALGLIYLVHKAGLPVAEWEAWNEPDGSPAYNGALVDACGSLPNNCAGVYDAGSGLCGATTYTQCGPLEAAGLYSRLEAALARSQSQYGWPIPPVAAGTTSWPSIGYFSAYLHQVTTVVGTWPAIVSFHAYADTTIGQAAQSNAFTKAIYNSYATAGQAQPTVWITESGVVLTDGDRSYNGHSITCDNGEPDDQYALGACVDMNATAQQAGANEFLSLAGNGAYAAGQISQVYWYQFQPANASTGWDSGLLAPPRAPAGTWYQLSPDGIYGSDSPATGERTSFCVLARLSSCSAGPVEDGDWSIQPRTASASLSAGQTAVSTVSGDQSGIDDGDFVTGPGIPAGTRLLSGAGTSSWTLSNPVTVTGAASLTTSD